MIGIFKFSLISRVFFVLDFVVNNYLNVLIVDAEVKIADGQLGRSSVGCWKAGPSPQRTIIQCISILIQIVIPVTFRYSTLYFFCVSLVLDRNISHTQKKERESDEYNKYVYIIYIYLEWRM